MPRKKITKPGPKLYALKGPNGELVAVYLSPEIAARTCERYRRATGKNIGWVECESVEPPRGQTHLCDVTAWTTIKFELEGVAS